MRLIYLYMNYYNIIYVGEGREWWPIMNIPQKISNINTEL